MIAIGAFVFVKSGIQLFIIIARIINQSHFVRINRVFIGATKCLCNLDIVSVCTRIKHGINDWNIFVFGINIHVSTT